MIKVLLADDHTLVREGLHRLLDDCGDMEVVGEACGGQEALRMLRQLEPDVVVMDLSMPDLDGIEATKQIARENLKARVLILTMHVNEEYAVRLLQAGAHGFMGKGAASQEVAGAIRKIAAGGSYLPSMLSEGLPKRYIRRGAGLSPLGALSDREVQVLKRLAEGHVSREIAQDLHLSTQRTKYIAGLQ